MPPSDGSERRAHHRLEFPAAVHLQPLDDELLDRPEVLRSHLRPEFRMLQWLQLANQYAFVRDSALHSHPALAPLVRLIDAKLDFLADEVLNENTVEKPFQCVQMSATGVDFDWPSPVEADSLWLVRIQPKGTDPALALPAVMQRVTDENDKASKRIAARFVALTSEETDALASWIVSRQAQSLSRRRRNDDC